MAFAPDSQTVALVLAAPPLLGSGKSIGRVQWRRIPDGRLLSEWQFPFPPASLSFSPDGSFLAVGGLEVLPQRGWKMWLLPSPTRTHIVVFRLPEGQSVFQAQLNDTSYFVQFSSDGQWLMAAGQKLRLWQVRDWHLVTEQTFGRLLFVDFGLLPPIHVSPGFMTDLTPSPDGRWLAVRLLSGENIRWGHQHRLPQSHLYLFRLPEGGDKR
jgi:WD40 repeat protein